MEPILETIEQPIMNAGMETMNEMFHPEVVTKSANLVEQAFAQGLAGKPFDLGIPVEVAGAAAGFVVGIVICGLIQLGFNAVMKEKQVPTCGCGGTAALLIIPVCTIAGALIAGGAQK